MERQVPISMKSVRLERTATLHLENLRKRTLWEDEIEKPATALSERLEELLVWQLLQDGTSTYLRLSVRSLYRHVLSSITGLHRPHKKDATKSTLSPTPFRKRSASVALPPDLTVSTSSGGAVTYRERLGGYLHPRDMRRLVTPFSASNEPQLIVRRHVMLFNFDPLRAIILRDRLLVIVPDGADAIINELESIIRGRRDSDEASYFGESQQNVPSGTAVEREGSTPILDPVGCSGASSDSQPGRLLDDSDTGTVEAAGANEWNEMEDRQWINLPFELLCADAVLQVVATILSEDAYDLQNSTLRYIHRLLSENAGFDDDPLAVIRAIKDAIREMTSRVKGFTQSLTRLLDEDEDMALMNLSRLLTHPERFIQPVSQEVLEEESDEPELILEAHLQTAMTLTNALHLTEGQIETAAELVDQKLDSLRNNLLYVNMILSIASLCVACISCVAGIFGMNLVSHLEENPHTFFRVAYSTTAASFLLGFVILVVLMYQGLIPWPKCKQFSKLNDEW